MEGVGKGLGFSLCAAPSPTIRKCPLISETEVQGVKDNKSDRERVRERGRDKKMPIELAQRKGQRTERIQRGLRSRTVRMDRST